MARVLSILFCKKVRRTLSALEFCYEHCITGIELPSCPYSFKVALELADIRQETDVSIVMMDQEGGKIGVTQQRKLSPMEGDPHFIFQFHFDVVIEQPKAGTYSIEVFANGSPLIMRQLFVAPKL